MAKKNRPVVDNPLAGMGLDDFVRGITTPDSFTKDEENVEDVASETPEKKAAKPRKGMKLFEEHLGKYTGINEQGVAVWLPKEVKKRLELIRVNAERNIPLRALAAAIIMTYVAENEEKLDNL